MPRRLIPLTAEIKDSESVSKLKSWEHDEGASHVSVPSGAARKSKERLLSTNPQRSVLKASEKLSMFSTKKVSKDSIASDSVTKGKAVKEIKDNAAVDKDKRDPRAKPETVKMTNKINYINGRNISLESFRPSAGTDDELKPQPPSRSPSLILPQLPTKNYLNLIKPKTGITLVDSDEEEKSQKCSEVNFDPREKQKLLAGKPIKVFKRGEKFFVKISEKQKSLSEGAEKSLKRKEIATCRGAITVRAPQLNLLTPLRRKSPLEMTLGRVFGIQHGTHNLHNCCSKRRDELSEATLGFDIAIVAHGMSHRKHPANWSERDIDRILAIGAELHVATKDADGRWSECTKGFVCGENFVEVNVSEAAVVGRIRTMDERSMDLYNGLCKFFQKFRCGIFETRHLLLYIASDLDGNFYVFDPRGRNNECRRESQREAALLLLLSIDNVYHLILNLSAINASAPFKISHVEVVRSVRRSDGGVRNEFTVHCGGKSRRGDDFEMLGEHVAVLRGNLSLNSSRHALTASIVAMIYAKIDPAVSWCKAQLDNVLHFGLRFFHDCLGSDSNDDKNAVVRCIKLDEIPSKFHVCDAYCVEIAIAAHIFRSKVTAELGEKVTEALREAFKAFRCLLLEIDGNWCAIWRTETSDAFFLFDGYKKTLSGEIDHFDGTAMLFVHDNIDFLGENIFRRFFRVPRRASATFQIHGMKIVELKKLSVKELKNRPRFKLAKTQCITPLSVEDAKNFWDVPSTVDACVPELTREQQLQLEEIEKTRKKKPLSRTITDLNSASMLCLKPRTYEQIMASVEVAASNETIEIMRGIYSDMLRKIDESEVNLSAKNSHDSACGGEFVGVAQKVLLKSDLECLERERKEILEKLANPSDETITEQPTRELTLSQEKLIKSHYHELPDKSQIIRGTKSIYAIPVPQNIFDHENFSILAAISAIVTSAKYSIATWSPEIVDYVLGCGQIMASALKLPTRLSLYTVGAHKLPKIHIGEKFYDLQMSAIASGEFGELENFLAVNFEEIDRVVVVTACGSVAVFKRKNFYYLFESATCNMVGYRRRNDDFGAACVVRFDNLHALVRRISANHTNSREEQSIVVFRVEVSSVDASDKRSFVPFTKSQEKVIIDGLRHNRMTKREQMIKKLRENDAKVRDEKERLQNFYADSVPAEEFKHVAFDESQLPSENYELEATEADKEEEVSKPFHRDWSESKQLGYSENDASGARTISGTFGYANRMRTSDSTKLRECHFASIYAIIYAVHHRPCEKMSYRCVDVALENGLRIFEAISVDNFTQTRALSQLLVSGMMYELKIVEFTRKPARIEELVKVFTEFFTRERAAIIEADTCSLAVVKSHSSFHIFDCYDSQDTPEHESEIENPIAAWSLHDNLDSVTEYLKTCLTPSEVRLHRVMVVSSEKFKSNTGNIMFNLSQNSSSDSGKECRYVDLQEDEKVEWLSDFQSIPWSRLQRQNADGVERYTRDSKWKEFDIEMGNRLYSLWGNIHPRMQIFRPFAGKQHLACCVVALVMSSVYNVDEWDAVLLDSVCTHGHEYFAETAGRLSEKQGKSQLNVGDLNGVLRMKNLEFSVELDLVIFGRFYDENRKRFNLNRALQYVFDERQMPGVILVCDGRSLAIGNVSGRSFFVYDSQSHGAPLFKSNQGTTYVLKCCCMKILMACIVLTLNVRKHNVKFYLYALKSRLVGEDAKEKHEDERGEEEEAAED